MLVLDMNLYKSTSIERPRCKTKRKLDKRTYELAWNVTRRAL